MKSLALTSKPYLLSIVTVLMAVTIGVVFLNPLWAAYSPPFPMPRVFPAITAPVDGPFYLRNADEGYRWESRDPLSLWFHPLMSVLVRIMPEWVSSNLWFWLISIIFAVGSIILNHKLINIYNANIRASAYLLPLILVVPGALGIATGNAEIPTLFFASALMLSVLHWQKWWLTIVFAICAILTKPNALYMLPMLLVYAISGFTERNTSLWKNAITGLLTIILGWITWMMVVDWKTGQIGTYWQSRLLFDQYTAGNLPNFFAAIANSFIYSDDIRDRVRYLSALVIPLMNLLILGWVPFARERDRYALAAGHLAMLAVVLLLGNPNKVIVYTTTIPGYFASFILLFQNLVSEAFGSVLHRIMVTLLCLTYCIVMLIFYVLGTPVGWYY